MPFPGSNPFQIVTNKVQRLADDPRNLLQVHVLVVDVPQVRLRLADDQPVRAADKSQPAEKGQGGQVGPDLSQIGALRKKSDLLEAVVFPSANFARGYEPYLVTTRAGKVYPTGILRRQTADAIYLMSGDRSEVRINRGEIESMELSKVSIMPQGWMA
jgi:putative heme-binding domain-containing protein